MAGSDNNKDLQLHQVAPTEQVGRDTIARYQAQYRAAAMECLKLLDRQSIDRVYCEFHDDFVSRRSVGGAHFYRFFQVKTVGKRNHLWSIADLFGIPKSKKKKVSKKKVCPTPAVATNDSAGNVDDSNDLSSRIADSFLGKLLLHTVRFGESCEQVSFLTNANLNDEVELVSAALEGGISEPIDVLSKLSEHFNSAYKIADPLCPGEIKLRLLKLSIEPGLTLLQPGGGDYEALASKAIYTYSEIDLTHSESAQIAANLVALVERKSYPKMAQVPQMQTLEQLAGIGLEDLLGLLSISASGYLQLLSGGDEGALKSASIIQRKLETAGAAQPVIDSACQWKVGWDNWYRTYRHLDEVDMEFILQDIARVRERWVRGEVSFGAIRGEALDIVTKWRSSVLGSMLTKELVLGGVLAELVRSESMRGGVS